MTSAIPHADKRICIGKITSAHGVKGLVKIFPYCDDITLLNGVLFSDESKSDTITITLKNNLGKYILAEIEGCSDKTDADALGGTALWINRDDLPETGEDEFYIEDLTGLNALNAAGEKIGIIQTVQNYGAGDLLEIKPPSGATYFVPFSSETVGDIDLDQQELIVINHERFILG